MGEKPDAAFQFKFAIKDVESKLSKIQKRRKKRIHRNDLGEESSNKNVKFQSNIVSNILYS